MDTRTSEIASDLLHKLNEAYECIDTFSTATQLHEYRQEKYQITLLCNTLEERTEAVFNDILNYELGNESMSDIETLLTTGKKIKKDYDALKQEASGLELPSYSIDTNHPDYLRFTAIDDGLQAQIPAISALDTEAAQQFLQLVANSTDRTDFYVDEMQLIQDNCDVFDILKTIHSYHLHVEILKEYIQSLHNSDENVESLNYSRRLLARTSYNVDLINLLNQQKERKINFFKQHPSATEYEHKCSDLDEIHELIQKNKKKEKINSSEGVALELNEPESPQSEAKTHDSPTHTSVFNPSQYPHLYQITNTHPVSPAEESQPTVQGNCNNSL